MFAVSGLGRFSASFSNVLYASTVYWKTVLSCWLVRMAGVASITVIRPSGGVGSGGWGVGVESESRVSRDSRVFLPHPTPYTPPPHSIFATFKITSPSSFDWHDRRYGAS